MRFPRFISVIPFAVLAFTVLAVERSSENDLVIIASFPESNPFGYVINGEKNSLSFSVENQSGQNATVLGISGSVHHAETGKLVKNLASLTLSLPLLDNVKIQIPYTFFSEFKPGDARLTMWLDYMIEGQKHRASAYDSVITIVEPESSIFDLKLLSTYLIVAAILGGAGYLGLSSKLAQRRNSHSKRPAASSASSDSIGASMTSGYQEEWIPELHLRKQKKATKPASGDDLSASEHSGAEGRKRKVKK